ncbi:xylulokinase [Spiribacter halobius]|uniref:Carbohydrate kinase n=1 Tax=Sediminicurvatus halobius TaxID=2182432 RepID=A0A2U2N0T5_9GAMM|nr:FGGY family carbohydrate kinase [Spiribacter halobius]PWG62796.1 carbohydrate kinase [Spiribacter halobius]UEX77057.1 hypothetical protein LMH63_14035 [Spiribacter halobius]
MTAAPLIGVDVSTTAVKACAWDAAGRPLGEARAALPLARPGPHRYEQDPEDWWRALAGTLRALAPRLPGPPAALAIAHQRETFVPVDAAGRALHPALLWLDRRGAPWVEGLHRDLPAEHLRALSGKTPNYGPALYKIAWLAAERPQAFRAAAGFCDVQAWLAERLTGRRATSWSGADPLGLLDLRTLAWSEAICRLVNVQPAQLPEVLAPGEPIGALHAEAAAATGLPAGTPLVAGGGDGQCAGLGVAALDNGRLYLNLGTAVVAGAWSRTPEVSPRWRTLTAGAGRGYYLESSLRSGALLSDWLLKRVAGLDPVRDREALAALEAEAAALPPGGHGVLLLPYWEGVMNPHWDDAARGAVLGLSDADDRASLYRAVVEGVALEQAGFLAALRDEAGLAPREAVAIGGPAASDLWCRVHADALDLPVRRQPGLEAAALGAAVCAAVGAGLHPDLETAAAAMAPRGGDVFTPAPDAASAYARLRGVHQRIYGTLAPLLRELDPRPQP